MKALHFGTLLVALSACTPQLVQYAEQGNAAAVRGEVTAQLRERALEESTVRDAAEATARHLLQTARGEALERTMHALAPCAHRLDSAYEALAEQPASQVTALTILADADEISLGRLEAFRDNKDAGLRGLGARTLIGPDHTGARHRAFLDPSPAVRRGAMRAALEKPMAEDEAELLDAARRDPDPYVQSTALRTLAILPNRSERLVGLLWDLWERADDAGRETLATAFALKPLAERGGQDVVQVVLAQKKGPGVIAGALAYARRSEDSPLRDLARSALVEHLRSGTQRERLFVLASTPLDWPAMVEMVTAASGDADTAVAVRAWGRRSEREPEAAKNALRVWSHREDAVGREARALLAGLHDLTQQASFERALLGTNMLDKRAAVRGLIVLNRMPRAAVALADADLAFRAEAACALLRE